MRNFCRIHYPGTFVHYLFDCVFGSENEHADNMVKMNLGKLNPICWTCLYQIISVSFALKLYFIKSVQSQ